MTGGHPSTRLSAPGPSELESVLSTLRASFQPAPFCVWARDGEGRVVFQNAVSRRLWGDQGGRAYRARGLDSEVAAQWRVANARALSGFTVREEVVYTLRGRSRSFYNIVTPIRGRHGVIGLLGYQIDVTRQRKVMEMLERRVSERTTALRRSEARLQRVLDASNDGYWEWDRPGDKVVVSRRLSEILGIPHGNGVTTREAMRNRVHPADLPNLTATVDRVIRPGAASDHYESEHRQCRPDGATVWVHVRATVTARDAAGMATRLTGMVTDITERKRFEHRILETIENEQQRIGSELHDGLAQLLVGLSYRTDDLHEVLKAQHHPEARRVATMGRYLHDAVRQLREVVSALHPVSAAPEGLMNALGRLAAFMQECFNVDCKFVCPVGVPVADPTVSSHLYRIAQEAAQNAAKHSGATRIRLSLRRTGRGLSLGVEDNGNGFSTPRGTQRRHLGLETMQFRAKAIGATLTIRSAKGRGVKVTCRLPALSG